MYRARGGWAHLVERKDLAEADSTWSHQKRVSMAWKMKAAITNSCNKEWDHGWRCIPECAIWSRRRLPVLVYPRMHV